MAFLEFKNVRIAGIAAGVPKNVASNLHPTDQDNISHEYTPEEYVAVHPDALDWVISQGWLPQDYVIPGNPSDPENTDNIHNIDEFE